MQTELKVLKFADLQTIAEVNSETDQEPFVKYQGLFVRKTVAGMLDKLDIEVELCCGYRSLEEQQRLFDEQMAIYNDVEKAHKYIAEPSVAGHPTGGAVDVRIAGMGEFDFIDCEYNPNDPRQRKLHEVMVDVGFAPFYGEWWHFSYGDKEWACYYGKKEALYNQKSIKEVEVLGGLI